MEGNLLVPPDRGTIIGRAVWKSRYVVIGPIAIPKDTSQQNLSLAQVLSSTRIKDVGGRTSKPQQLLSPDAIYLSIYKTKEELDLVQQHSIASIKECQVQHIAHRKQGHVLPTLCVQVSPDPVTDKLRKRRSSRTAGLTTTKDSGPTTLWFRSADDSSYSLADWARYIQALIQPGVPDGQPMSPISPTSPTFINPFAPNPSQGPTEYSSSANVKGKKRSKVRPKTFASSRDPAAAYSSESPSLRSRKSDLSSRASLNPAGVGYGQQHYTLVHPSELPSPAPTVGEYNNDLFIEGWTSAQGRSSTLSSPIRGRASMSSSQCPAPPSLDSSSPPAPRETILDRAFQLRCIPGSDRELPGEEKLSSIARFEALMREAENRQRILNKGAISAQEPMRSTWEDDESDDEGDLSEQFENDEEEEDSDGFEHDVDNDGTDPSASKALHFIASRHTSNPARPPWPLSARATVHYSSSGGFDGGPSVLRPHTAHSRLRTTQRTSSQPQLPAPAADVIKPTASTRVPDEPPKRPTHEKRHSTSDVKHLGFNDFTKRLSSTSSLLLVQTNASAGSSRGSSEFDQTQQATPRANLSPRGPSLAPNELDERCRWRGSIGVFGANEGGFL